MIVPVIEIDDRIVSVNKASRRLLFIGSACPRFDGIFGPTHLDLIADLDVNEDIVLVAYVIQRIL